MTDERRRRSRASTAGRPFTVELPGRRRVPACASSPPTPRPTTASTTSSRTRCCGSSSTTCGTSRNAPDIRRDEVEAFEFGYNVVNEDLARAVLEEIEGEDEPVVMVHDYHLYTLPALVRRGAARTSSCTTSSTSRGRSRTPGACCPATIRDEIYRGLLANDIVGFHTRSYRRNFLQCCRDLMDLEVDFERGVVRFEGREVWVRAYPLPIDAEATRAVAQRPRARRSSSASCCAAAATT